MEDDDKEMMESRHIMEEDKDEEERLDKSDIVYRTLDLSRASHIDEENRRVRIRLVLKNLLKKILAWK